MNASATPRHARALLLGAALLLGLAPALSGAAPQAELWDRWTAHDPQATRLVDHGAWSAFLSRYLREDGSGVTRVAYGAVNPEDRAALDGYLTSLAATPVSQLGRNEQLALWINLYNALTVQVVLAHYPVESIRDIAISPGFFSVGPWKKKLLTVEGEPLSLDDIEHRILRPIWRDPRIHYAVNCASIGCPNLVAEPFTGGRADALLDSAARAYVNHPRGARVQEGRLYISSIYDWFRADFGGDERSVIAHLRAFSDPALRQRLEGIEAIAGYDYDWRLNDAPARVSRRAASPTDPDPATGM